MLLVFFFLIAVRVNIGFALILPSLAVLWLEGLPFTSAVNQMFAGIDSFTLLAVPFFMLLGRILNAGSITIRLLEVADTTVGHVRGGLGHVNVFVSMVFASLSGSAVADTASVGSILIPAMKKAGYPPHFAAALTAASSTLGVIIPPSIILIIYGAFGNVSIGALFMGGIVPGLLIASQIAGANLGRAMLAAAPICILTISVAVLSLWIPDIVLGLPKLLVPELFPGG